MGAFLLLVLLLVVYVGIRTYPAEISMPHLVFLKNTCEQLMLRLMSRFDGR